MILLSEAVEIKTTPEALFDFACNLERHFHAMSEKHIKFENVKGDPVTEGSIFYQEEWFADKRISRKYIVKRVIPNRFIEWEALFPRSVIGDKMMIFITPRTDYVELKELILLGKESKVIGKALDWSINHMLEPHFRELQSLQLEGLQYVKSVLEGENDQLQESFLHLALEKQKETFLSIN